MVMSTLTVHFLTTLDYPRSVTGYFRCLHCFIISNSLSAFCPCGLFKSVSLLLKQFPDMELIAQSVSIDIQNRFS